MAPTTYAKIIDAVPNVANPSDRDARYPSPDKYQKVYVQSLNAIQQWDGSAWQSIILGTGTAGSYLFTGTGSPEGVVTSVVGGFYIQTDGGGGEVFWAKNAGVGNTGWRPIQTGLGEFNPEDFGADVLASPTTNTTAIQSAVTAAIVVGGRVRIPQGISSYFTIDGVVNVPGSCTITGPGELRTTSSTAKVLNITGSNVTVRGLRIIGPSTHASAQSTGEGISVTGTSAAGPATDITIAECYVSGFSLYGIKLEWVDGFKVVGTTVNECANAGIIGLSVLNGRVHHNQVETIGATDSTYGIGFSRRETNSITTEPACSDILCDHNRVKGVTFWEGLDTHGGTRITFDSNIVTGCLTGIGVGPTDNASEVPTWAPTDVVVVDNIFDSLKTDGTASYGINFAGVSASVFATGSVIGNIFRGHGTDVNALTGACVRFVYTKYVHCALNKLYEPSPIGINWTNDNYEFLCEGNTIVDAWSNLLSVPAAFGVPSNNNTGQILNNRMSTGTKSATHVNVNGIRIDGASGMAITFGVNDFASATTNPYTNPGAVQTLGPESIKRTSVGDADVTLTVGVSSQVQVYSTVLTSNRTVTLSTTDGYDGARFRVIRAAGGAFTLAVGSAYTFAASEQGTVDVVFQAGAWRLEGVRLLVTPAPLASPTFTGTPTMPTGTVGTTQTANDNSTKLATTAYVDRATTHTGTTSAAPTGTTSATAVMMGLAGSITPTRGTKIIFMASGQMGNSTAGSGATADLRFGTGAAPTNGAAVTGTLVGIAQTETSVSAAQRSGFQLMGKVTGLSVGTAYWFDLSLLAPGGTGTATITGASLVAFEVP